MIRLVIVVLTPFLFYKQTLEIINRVFKKRYKIDTPLPFDLFYYWTFSIILPIAFTSLLEKDPLTFLGLKVANQIEFQAALGLLVGALIAIFIAMLSTAKPQLGVSLTINDNLKRIIKSSTYSFSEEFFWRGFIQSNLAIFFPFPIFIIAAAAPFGIFHLIDPSVRLRGIAMRMVHGVILGFLFFFTGNLISPFIAHASCNVFARIPNILFKRNTRMYRTLPKIPLVEGGTYKKGYPNLREYVRRRKHYIVIENSKLSAVVSPDEGGRIVYLYDKQTKHGKTYVGLLHDIAMETGWPGFDKASYDYEVIHEKPQAIKLQHLIGEDPLKGIKIIKTIWLEGEKAAIKVDYTIHNSGDKERTVTLRVRGTLVIVGKQLDTQYAALQTVSGTKTIGYGLLATKFIRKNDLKEGWVTVFERDTMEQVGMVWNPKNLMALLILGDYHAFSIELFFNSITVKAGEKSLPLTLFICTGSGPTWHARHVYKKFMKTVKNSY